MTMYGFRNIFLVKRRMQEVGTMIAKNISKDIGGVHVLHSECEELLSFLFVKIFIISHYYFTQS